MPRMSPRGKVGSVLANARKAKGSGAARLAPAQKADLAKAAADWSKNGANASDESFKVLARYRASKKGASASAAGPRRSWGDAVGKPRRPPAVEAARIRAAGGSLKDQAAAHRAAKGSRVERLQSLDAAADRRYQAVKGRALSDKGRTVAYDRSVEISRHLYRAQEGKQTLAKGRGTAERARAAEVLKRAKERLQGRKPTAPTPPPTPTAAPKSKIKVKVVSKQAKPVDPSTHTDHSPGHVGPLQASFLHVDPNRFQYKLSPGTGGATGSLSGVKKWNDEYAGILQVWKDPKNGKVYVVNGHNRAHLAKQLGVEKLNVRFLDAKDAGEARAKGALTNIAEGQGTALDAAKFFRDTGIHDSAAITERGIPLTKKIATEGLALAKLERSLFNKVVAGEIPHERAVIIGGSGLDHDQQRQLAQMVQSRPKTSAITNDTLRELTDTIRSSASKTVTTRSLFGDDEESVNLAIQKATLQAKIKERLSREHRLFGTVAKSSAAKELSRGNNSIDQNASHTISKEAAEALDVFDRLKNLAGPIARKLNEGASRLHAGERAPKVYDEIYLDILNEIPSAHKF